MKCIEHPSIPLSEHAVEEVRGSMEKTVVVYPPHAMGHLVPMVELAKLFTLHGFSVAVVLMSHPTKPPSIDTNVSCVSSAHPSISFHQLPPPSSFPDPTADHFVDVMKIIRLNTAQLRRFLAGYTQTSDVRAVVMDFCCIDALDVTAELRLPSYVLYPAGACSLASFLYFPTRNSVIGCSYKDLDDARVEIPGIPPIPASDMPRETSDRENGSYEDFLLLSNRLPDADCILVNTFESLEPRTVEVIRSGACVPDRRIPPVYCIGPLVAEGSRGDEGPGMVEEKAECLVWLDTQSHRSVVFLCFGSMGTFPVEQLMEIATGLEKSDQRFLWVVRAPPVVREGPSEEPPLDALLPEGFVERTKGRGLVVKSWAPQLEVLNHEAVGGFVTHCGWNSIIEAITAGVAMVAWPLYAEQRINKHVLVEQMRLAVTMEGYDKELVAAEEVEAKVRWLMESEGGRELREGAAKAKDMAAKARRVGGSSYRALMELKETL